MSAPRHGETLDRLAGDWWIFQLERGHRYATDDLAVAWAGLRARPDARRVLELGAGTGSVGLLTLMGLLTLPALRIEEEDRPVGIAVVTLVLWAAGSSARANPLNKRV